MIGHWTRRCRAVAITGAVAATVAGCQWQGVNTLPLPGTEGRGAGSYTIEAQMSDVDNIQRNSRVRVGDVNVGTVTDIQRQGWHALVTISLNGDVDLPENATVKIGQTSLLGSKHIELAPPTSIAPQGKLHQGSVISLGSNDAYPNTEQTLAAVSMILNGGGISRIQEITQVLSTAFAGRANDLRSFIQQLDVFTGHLSDQTDDITAATTRLNELAGQLNDQLPVLEQAAKTIPDALKVLSNQREQLVDALDKIGRFAAVTADTVDQTKDNLVRELKDVGPVVESLANAGPALTRSLGFLSVFPFPKDGIDKWFRGDYANLTAIIDLTLSRIDSSLFTGTRWEGNLTELEMQWGRTIGQLPSPYTAGNPLVAPYRFDQGR